MIARNVAAGVAAAALLASSAGFAADANNRFSVRGIGTSSCAKYLESRNIEVAESEQYAHWLTGFLTAYNYLKPETYDIAAQYKSTGLLRYLDLYCGKNPKNKIVDAATSFVQATYDKRMTKAP